MEQCKVKNTVGSCGCQSEKAIDRAKGLVIDFMYIDLQTCTRCQGTEASLHEALQEVGALLHSVGYEVKVNSILIENETHAESLQFISSPTIRVNGLDIQMESKESLCESCGCITGTDVDCRVWEYNGQEYTELPKALIIDRILSIVYGKESKLGQQNQYVLPENIKAFFEAKRRQESIKTSCEVGSNNCC